jgi:hypothetical protein
MVVYSGGGGPIFADKLLFSLLNVLVDRFEYYHIVGNFGEIFSDLANWIKITKSNINMMLHNYNANHSGR